MSVTFLIVAVFVFSAIFLMAYTYLTGDSTAQLEEQVGLVQEREWLEQTKLIKVFYPLIQLLKPVMNYLYVPRFLRKRYQQWIISAGLEGYLMVADIIGLQIVFAIGFAVMSNIWFGGGAKLIVLFSIIGAVMPVFWIHQAAKERREQIMRSLPSVIDMIALSVGAGIDFNSAVERVVEQEKDYAKENETFALIHEFKVYLQNVRLGMGRSEALQTLADRVDAPDIYSFTAILIQADKMGASISDTLKQQALALREERFLQAEKAGAVASQKIMIPMMLFIFPLIFAIILLPLLLKFIYQ